MDLPDRLGDRFALRQLNDDYGYFLDHGEVAALTALFTEDALYTNGPRISQGRDEIEAFFHKRLAGGPRTSRHFYSGLRVTFVSETEAKGFSNWLAFASPGVAPIQMADPFNVADFEDLYRLEDGRWRIAERHIRSAFLNPDVPPPGTVRT